MSEFLCVPLNLVVAGTSVSVAIWYKPSADRNRRRVRIQDMEASNPILLRVLLAESLDHIQHGFGEMTGYTISRSAIQDWIIKIQPKPSEPALGKPSARTSLGLCPRCQGGRLRQVYNQEPSCLICGYAEYAVQSRG